MQKQELSITDSEEFEAHWAAASGVDTEVLQLSRGPIDFGLTAMEMGELSLIWTEVDGRTRWRDRLPNDALHLGIPMGSEGPLKVNGHQLTADEALIWIPGQEFECVFDGPYKALEIGIATPLLDRMGWEVRGKPLNRIPRKLLNPLVAVCKAASRAMDSLDAEEFGSSLAQFWRDEILERLEPVLQPWLVDPVGAARSPGTRHHELVRKADQHLSTHGYHNDSSIDDLSKAIGVPRRTIFHAYRQVLGIGPRRYLELVRLHQLRSNLKQAPANETVTTLALESGFQNLGRMSALYHEQFGEYPSDTLKLARHHID